MNCLTDYLTVPTLDPSTFSLEIGQGSQDFQIPIFLNKGISSINHDCGTMGATLADTTIDSNVAKIQETKDSNGLITATTLSIDPSHANAVIGSYTCNVKWSFTKSGESSAFASRSASIDIQITAVAPTVAPVLPTTSGDSSISSSSAPAQSTSTSETNSCDGIQLEFSSAELSSFETSYIVYQPVQQDSSDF